MSMKFQQATNFYQNVSKSYQSLASLFEWRRESLSKLKKNMPRLTVDQRVWVCIEYARTNNLDPQMIRSAFAGMVDRVNKCITVNGNTFPNE